jgi:hypothetical protein
VRCKKGKRKKGKKGKTKASDGEQAHFLFPYFFPFFPVPLFPPYTQPANRIRDSCPRNTGCKNEKEVPENGLPAR